MNQQNQGINTASIPAMTPAKRKRGRPRKHAPPPINAQVDDLMVNLLPDRAEGKEPVLVESGDEGTDDEMVGKVVKGALGESFGAGYLLTVKVGETNLSLRGVVFKEGKFVPITSENDIVPGLKMHKRKQVTIPELNKQIEETLETPSNPSLGRQESSVAPNPAEPSEPHFAMPSASAAIAAHSASSIALPSTAAALTDQLPRDVTPEQNASEALVQLEQQKQKSPNRGFRESEALAPTSDQPVKDVIVSVDKHSDDLQEQETLVKKEGLTAIVEEGKGGVPVSDPERSIQPVYKQCQHGEEKDSSTQAEGAKTGDKVPVPDLELNVHPGEKENKDAEEKDSLTKVDGPKIGDRVRVSDPEPNILPSHEEGSKIEDEAKSCTEPASSLLEKLASPHLAEETKMDDSLMDHTAQEGATSQPSCNFIISSLNEDPVPSPVDTDLSTKVPAVSQSEASLAESSLPEELVPSVPVNADCVADDRSTGPGSDDVQPMDCDR